MTVISYPVGQFSTASTTSTPTSTLPNQQYEEKSPNNVLKFASLGVFGVSSALLGADLKQRIGRHYRIGEYQQAEQTSRQLTDSVNHSRAALNTAVNKLKQPIESILKLEDRIVAYTNSRDKERLAEIVAATRTFLTAPSPDPHTDAFNTRFSAFSQALDKVVLYNNMPRNLAVVSGQLKETYRPFTTARNTHLNQLNSQQEHFRKFGTVRDITDELAKLRRLKGRNRMIAYTSGITALASGVATALHLLNTEKPCYPKNQTP
jgi:hypothetical protein